MVDQRQLAFDDAVAAYFACPEYARRLHLLAMQGFAATNSATDLGRAAAATAELLEAVEAFSAEVKALRLELEKR